MAGLMSAGPMLLAGLMLAGCSTAGTRSGTSGFVAGSGTVTVLAEADRRPVPEVKGESLTGEPIDLSDYAGQVVVLNVWAAWCVPCRTEAPQLVAAAERLAGDRVAFLGINVRDTKAAASAFADGAGLTYPSLFDPSGETLLGFRETLPPTTIPSTLVIDADGEVAARVLGEVTETTLVDLVHEVAAQS